MTGELYISIDIESSGPIPGEYAMLSLGACLVENSEESFYVELCPTSDKFDPAALKVTGFDLAKLQRDGEPPSKAMQDFCRWVSKVAGGRRPVFVGFNATYDWQFVNWYLHKFVGNNPFGFGGVDIKAYFMGMSGRPWEETSSSKLPAEFQPDYPQTHNALDDAKAQASIFAKMLNASRR